MLFIVAIEQKYPGHAKQVGFLTSQCHTAAYASRFIIVVDEDINPNNLDDVFWALCTRADLKEGVDVIHRCWTSPADLMHYPEGEGKPVFGSRMIIDACKPFERREKFRVVETSKGLKERTSEKYRTLFEKNYGPRL
jgi:UbiD family decarboxylase